jgi:predicted ATPase/class 3 adenylate cyclase
MDAHSSHSGQVLPGGTLTFLFTDIEGSTRLWEQHADAMREAIARHDALAAAVIEEHKGRLIKSRGEGDSLFAVFPLATDAVAAACALQRAFVAEPWPKDTPLRVRIALYTGEADLRMGDYYGSAVNRCARLRAIAHGGQTLLSETTCLLVRDFLPEGVTLLDMGWHRLKDLQDPEHVYQLLHPGLPADFPPLRSLSALPNNLPHQLTSFIGREREMEAVKRLLASNRLLTLTGSGGCGKTRLALQMAADLLHEYPDGVWLAQMEALTDPALVPQTVAAAVSVREEPGRPMTRTLAEFLRPQNCLLVLDNCEHLVAACAELAAVLLQAAPNVRILATSREALGITGETAWRVPSLLSPPARKAVNGSDLMQYEAVRLFVERAAAARSSFAVSKRDAEIIAQICRRLDGIPLAIELAAARVKMLTVEQIAARLDDLFRLLTGGSRTALPRQQTLLATMDWSYNLLSEQERKLLRRLSVFAGGCTVEAAEAVCADREEGDSSSLPPSDVLDLLLSLVDKSLLVFEEREGEGRYRLLESVRQYGSELLAAQEEVEVLRRRFLDFYLHLAEEAEPHFQGPEEKRWLDRLETEHDNMRAALAWALQQGEAEASLRMVGILHRLWLVRGYLSEGRRWASEALQKRDGASETVMAKALNVAGILAWSQGDYVAARPFYGEALAIWRRQGDRQRIAGALINMGILAREDGDFEKARSAYEEALAISRELGYWKVIAAALSNLGTLAMDRGDFAAARPLLEEALAADRASGDRWAIALTLYNLGATTQEQGDFAAARSLLLESLAMWRDMGERRGIAYALGELGIVAVQMGDHERAARLLGAAEAAREAMGIALTPTERAGYEPEAARVRAGLSQEAFEAAWNAGRAMTPEQAVAFALEQPES